MSQYNKTVLTNAGLELAKRANAGQARFEITRAVTSADDWSNKTIQDIEAVTTIPNIMQQGTIMDTEEVESNNSVMGVSLCFTNKNLSAGYQIKIIGVYVKEEGQENDFLYAVTTAVSPEYMPDFSDKVLYRFNMQLYLVIGKTQVVNVVINDGASVTHKQFDKYKGEVAADLEKIENAHKEDMSHVVKSASINGGDEILPDEAGKLELVVPDPDLSKYVSLEQLKEMLKGKADKADTYTKSNIDDIHSKTYFRKQGIDQNGNTIEIRKNAIKLDNGGYAFDIWSEDWTASKLADVLAQLPNKADTSTVNAQITDAKNTIKSNVNNLQNTVNNKADKSQVNVGGSLFRMVSAGNNWNDILGFDNGGTPALVAFRGNAGGAMNNLLGNFSAGVAFGGGDTKGFLEVSYADHNARIGGGNGGAPVWHEDIAWKSDITNLQNIINQQNQTIQSLTSRLNNAENEINYIKANYVEGRRFPASQEAQAEAWENENPQRIAFIDR